MSEPSNPSTGVDEVKPPEASTGATTNKDRSELPRWLQKLQNESWQAEMLISGGAVFALFGAFDPIVAVATYAEFSTEIPYMFIASVGLATILMAFVLIVGFVVHLALRGFWIGLIGLNYVYPEGIVLERLKFAGKFATGFRDVRNNEFILRIDRFCSTIFAMTFLSLFSMTGLIIYFMILILPITIVPELGSKWIGRFVAVLLVVFLLAGIISLLDFVLGGRLKRIRWFSHIYYPIHRLVSVITLSFIYRRLYYTLVTNIGGFRLALTVAAPFVLMITIASIFDSTDTQLSTAMFSAGRAGHKLGDEFLSIEKEVVENSFLDVFITHPVRLEAPAFEQWKVAHTNVKEEDFSDLPQEQQMELIKQLYLLKLDGKPVADSSDWFITNTKPENAFVDMPRIVLRKSIDLSGLDNGPHELSVRIALDSSKLSAYPVNREAGNHARIRFLLRMK